MENSSDRNLSSAMWLGCAAFGALAMYMLDPERGASRRNRSAARLKELGQQTGSVLGRVKNDMKQGAILAAEMSDRAVQSMAAMTRSGQQPGTVAAGDGTVGQGDAAGMHSLADFADATSKTQQSGSTHSERRLAADEHMSTLKASTIAGGGLLGLYGLLAPRSPLATALGLAGLALIARTTAAEPVRVLARAGQHGRPVTTEKTVSIEASPERLYDLFSDYQNFPRFMSNVVEVSDMGGGRSHWVVKGPMGSQFTWNAVLTANQRPERLAWKTEPGSEIEHSGSIEIVPFRSSTRVTVRLSYQPPAGKLGHALAALFGRDPGHQLEDDLGRIKSLLERGETARTGTMDGGVRDGSPWASANQAGTAGGRAVQSAATHTPSEQQFLH